MRLWTIQPLEVLEILERDGVFRCDSTKIPIPEFREAYDWLVHEMNLRIGGPPDGVRYPVWAWYILDNAHKKPDLRKERWGYGRGGEQYVCIEIEIPDNQVLLSDFDAWSNILLHALLSDTESEDKALEAYYQLLSPEEQLAFKHTNWQRVFDISPFMNEWTRRGECVQATFWELKAEQIVSCRRFITGKLKRLRTAADSSRTEALIGSFTT